MNYLPSEAAAERLRIAKVVHKNPPAPPVIKTTTSGTFPTEAESEFSLMFGTTAIIGGTVTATPAPVDGGYAAGTVVTVLARPAAGYRFTGWRQDATGTANPIKITMNGVKMVTPLFSKLPPQHPEIAVQQPYGTNLIDGVSTRSFGSIFVKSTATKTFVIRNTGTANLGGIGITKGGANPGDFLVTSPAHTTLAPGASSTFTVVFQPTVAGNRSATLQIASNDADENPFGIAITGTGITSPEIVVEQPIRRSLKDGSPEVAFGPTAVNKAATKTFIIRNTGTAKLTRLAVTISGPQSGDFIASQPLETSLQPADSTTFRLTFRPSAKGTRNAAIRIQSNDRDENPFDIKLTGTGVIAQRSDDLAKSSAPLPVITTRYGDSHQSSVSTVRIQGRKYACIKIRKNKNGSPRQESVEVSPNLVDWFSGRNHTTVLEDSTEVLKVRDNIATDANTKRFIRVKGRP